MLVIQKHDGYNADRQPERFSDGTFAGRKGEKPRTHPGRGVAPVAPRWFGSSECRDADEERRTDPRRFLRTLRKPLRAARRGPRTRLAGRRGQGEGAGVGPAEELRNDRSQLS